MNNNNTAADREKAVNGKTMQAMNEQYKNCKTERREYQVGKERFLRCGFGNLLMPRT